MGKEFDLSTVGDIVRRHGIEVHRIEYILKSRGIEPVARAGNARLYSPDAVKRILEEVKLIESRR